MRRKQQISIAQLPLAGFGADTHHRNQNSAIQPTTAGEASLFMQVKREIERTGVRMAVMYPHQLEAALKLLKGLPDKEPAD